MPQERLGDKLEEGLGQVAASVKDLAAKAGVGSGADTMSFTNKKSDRASARTASRTRAATGRTKDELYAEAARLGIKGRSRMTKAELEKAVRRG